MRQRGNCSSSHNGRRSGFRSLPLQAVRPLSRVYKTPPLARANAREIGAAKGSRNPIPRLADSCLAVRRWPRIGGPTRYRPEREDFARVICTLVPGPINLKTKSLRSTGLVAFDLGFNQDTVVGYVIKNPARCLPGGVRSSRPDPDVIIRFEPFRRSAANWASAVRRYALVRALSDQVRRGPRPRNSRTRPAQLVSTSLWI